MALADATANTQRIVSAAILAPLPVAAIWFGAPYVALLAALCAAVMGWEWARLCRGAARGEGQSGRVLIAAAVLAVAVAAVSGLQVGLGVAVAGAALVYGSAVTTRERAPLWLALGALWIAVPCVLLVWLAGKPAGRTTLLWLLAVVWATDIGAYAIGRGVGGPRLAPRWSPGKTWAGLIGGAGCAALAGWATARIAGSSALPLVLASGGLAIVEQFGDLAESVAKRRFGVKDSSGLIPGHGGLLDRLDGLLAAIPAAALLSLFGGGVLTWQ